MQPGGYFEHVIWDSQYLWSNVLYDVNKLVYMTIYVLEIELVSSFSALYHFFFFFLYFI